MWIFIKIILIQLLVVSEYSRFEEKSQNNIYELLQKNCEIVLSSLLEAFAMLFEYFVKSNAMQVNFTKVFKRNRSVRCLEKFYSQDF